MKKTINQVLLKNFSLSSKNMERRHSWIETTLKKIPAGSRILDAGAGELAQKIYCSHLNYVSQDFGQYNGSGDGKGFQTDNWDNSKLDIICDITNIPEANKSFDAIMCIEVFEHLPEPIVAIKEFSRLLKTGGHLILTAPFCSMTHFSPYHFYTGFNRYFYEKHLAENNFEIIEMTYNGDFFEYIAQELLRIPNISKNYANTNISILDKLAIFKLIRKLKKISRKDNGSEELLCFGIQILAKKNR